MASYSMKRQKSATFLPVTSETIHWMKRSHSQWQQHRKILPLRINHMMWGTLHIQGDKQRHTLFIQDESRVLKETSHITKFTYKFNAKPFKIWANTEEGGSKLYMGVIKRLKCHYKEKFHITYQHCKCIYHIIQIVLNAYTLLPK